MMPRFHLPDPAPRDSEIISRMTRLKIELYKDSDGDLHGEFKIGGGVGMFGDGEEDFEGDKQAKFMAFVGRLLTEFEKKPEGLT